MDRKELGRSLNLKVELIATDNPNRSGRPISAEYITIHNTSNDNPGADANAHSRFVRERGFYHLASGKRNFVSWHYTVDDNMIIKHLPVNERAIHAGKGNNSSIGIEICMHRGIDQVAANQRAARLVAVLMHDLRIPKANVKTHKFWTKKACPILLLNDFDGFCETADNLRQSIEEKQVSLESSAFGRDDSVTEEEVEAVIEQRGTRLETNVLESDDHPDDEHGLIAAEVSKMIRGPRQ